MRAGDGVIGVNVSYGQFVWPVDGDRWQLVLDSIMARVETKKWCAKASRNCGLLGL
jgi:hypothetical protein